MRSYPLQKVSVERLTLYVYSDEYKPIGDKWAAIVPLKAEDAILAEGNPAEAFKLIDPDGNQGFQAGDRITTSEGQVFIVKSLRKFTFRSSTRVEAFIYSPNND